MDVRAVAHLSVAGITGATGNPPLWLTTFVYWPSACKIKSRTKLCDTNGHGDTGSLTAEKPCWRMRWPPPGCSWQSMSASAPGGISSLSLTFSLCLSLCPYLSLSLSSPPECWANHWTNHCSGLPVFPQQVVGICGVITCDSGFRVVKNTNLSNQAPPLRDRSGDRAGKLSVYLTLRLVGCCSSLGGG